MAVKGVIVNPMLGAVVLSKGIVGLAGINLLRISADASGRYSLISSIEISVLQDSGLL